MGMRKWAEFIGPIVVGMSKNKARTKQQRFGKVE